MPTSDYTEPKRLVGIAFAPPEKAWHRNCPYLLWKDGKAPNRFLENRGPGYGRSELVSKLLQPETGYFGKRSIMKDNKKQTGRNLTLLLLGFLLLLPASMLDRNSGVVRAQAFSGYSVAAQFDTDVTNWCTTEKVGSRQWILSATYDPGTGVLSGFIKFTNDGEPVSGKLKQYSLVDNFEVFDVDGTLLANIPSTLPNQPSGDYPFSSVTLAKEPYLVKVSGTQYRNFGQCPPGPFQDDYSFPFEDLATNPYFTIPCPVINSFTISPNPVSPSANVTLSWNVSNLFIGRRIRFSGNGAPASDQTTPSGSVSFAAPSTPGNYSYTLTIYERDGSTVVGCVAPATTGLTVASTSYFWLVKRLPKEGVAYPPGAPAFYVEPDLGTAPPGSNSPDSFSRVPDTGTFTAPSFQAALTLEPYLSSRKAKEATMRFNDRTAPGGLVSPDFLRANGDYNYAFDFLYPKAQSDFNRQVPGYSGPRQGPGIPANERAPKRNERVDPFEN